MGGGSKPQSKRTKPIGALQIQTSVYGTAVPLIYGKNRVAINLIQFEDFKAIPHTDQTKTGGKGGSKAPKDVTYTYQVACAMALCEGSASGIQGVGTIWLDKEKHTLSDLGLTLFNGADSQTTWSYMASAHPTRAVPYQRTAYLAHASFDLGSSASMPNINVEVKGLVPWNAGTIDDAEPSAILTDYLTEAQHGAGLGSYLGSLTAFHDYCVARGLFISPIENNQRNAASFVQEVADLCNSAPVWQNGKLVILPYGDTAIAGNGATYTPDLTPVYALTADDFMRDGSNTPIKHTRKPQAQAYNHIRIEYCDRLNEYNPVVVEAKDAADIDDNGLRSKSVIQAHAITTAAVARDVAQIAMQRELMVRNSYSGRLSVKYSRLEPMDYLSLTDADLGLVNQLVRITRVREQDDSIDIECEEVNVGAAHAPLYGTQTWGGYTQDYNAAPGAVLAPVIMNAAGLLAPSGYETWIAICGPNNGLWGGCTVWLSDDGTNYHRAGQMYAPCRYGALAATLPIGAQSDTTNTLQVTLNQGQILSGTATDATEWRTLLYAGGEWISYQTATLVSGTTYNLTLLQRGGYGSAIAGHAIGDAFALIDEGVFRVPYDRGNVGKLVYFKFTSFNIFGGGQETLAAATAYTHVLGASDITAPYVPTDAAVLSIVSGLTTIDCARGDHFKLSLTANTAPRFINVPSKFTLYVEITQTGTTYTYTNPSSVTSVTGIAYAASTVAGQVDVLTYQTFDSGVSWRLTYVKPASAMAVTIAPSPASATANSVSGANVSPSVVVTATVTGNSGAVTYAWARADSGNPTHTCSNAAIAAPTFSIPSGHTVQSNANSWRCTATDAASNIRTALITITLTVTSSGSPPLTQTIAPDVSSEFKVGHSWSKNITSTLSGGSGTSQTRAWSRVSGSTAFTLTNSTAATCTLTLPNVTAYGTYTAVYQCIGNDSLGTPVTTAFTVSVELNNGL